MDSKYASIGLVKTNNLKRKISLDNLKVKKLKLTNDSAPGSVLGTNGHTNQNCNKESKIAKATPSEDLQDARRRLPVYTVRGRYAIKFCLYLSSIFLPCQRF